MADNIAYQLYTNVVTLGIEYEIRHLAVSMSTGYHTTLRHIRPLSSYTPQQVDTILAARCVVTDITGRMSLPILRRALLRVKF